MKLWQDSNIEWYRIQEKRPPKYGLYFLLYVDHSDGDRYKICEGRYTVDEVGNYFETLIGPMWFNELGDEYCHEVVMWSYKPQIFDNDGGVQND